MLDLERQKERFKDHVATPTDYGNIKILDFQKPGSFEYRIRFLFEEDYYRLHISGDLGELIAMNYTNMTFNDFTDFVNNTGYFKEKIICHSRAIYYYNHDLAIEELTERLLRDYSSDINIDEVDNLVDDILYDYSDKTGIGNIGYEKLSEIDPDAFEWVGDVGKEPTGILDLYMLAFKLAKEQLKDSEVTDR